ncbi:DUF4410 domain-containing protein [Edaphobacter sp. HDX4]|uniref:DUF4410 domain-containing protein n=1 Tax=Edaphobacter sp. HDX4 TaxID=2794064 RepID=UPI002FE644B1
MKLYLPFALKCALLAIAAAPLISNAQSNSSSLESQPRTAVVLRFAVESQSITGRSELSAQACPQTGDETASPTATAPSKSVTVDPKILDAISAEMQKRLSRKMSVMVDPDSASIPVGALVISGCITKANPGNAAKRLIGMNVGASRLGVHVVAVSKKKDGWRPVDTFDLEVKGGDLLPPLGPAGLAVHAARDTRQSLSSDSKKLADHILKKLSTDMKAREGEIV